MESKLIAAAVTEQQLYTESFRRAVKERSDKLMDYFLPAFFIAGLALAFYFDTWLIAVGVGGLCLIAYYSVKRLLKNSELYQYVLSVVLGIFMAQYIYQMHGMFEMHFFAFIGSAILITYQNWKLQIPLVAVVVVHHGTLGYLQNIGYEKVYFTQLDFLTLQTFIMHVILAAVIFFICGLWGYQLKKYSEAQIKQSVEMGRLQKEAMLAQELAILKESLEKEKYLLDSLMDNMPDLIYFKDTENKFTRVSKHMAERYNTTVSELIGKTDFDFHDESYAMQSYKDERNIQKTRKPKIDFIEKSIKEDGTETWLSTTKMPLINARGEVVGTFGMSRDITKVKTLEKERHAADMDKAIAQGKFEIASEVMHDIGNAVVGFGSYITRIRRLLEHDNPQKLQNLAGFFQVQQPALSVAIGEAKAGAVVNMLKGITETQKSNEEEIRRSISEQINIITHIQEILDIQRQYISGHNSNERKPVSISNIINDSLAMLLAATDKTGISVTSNIAPDLPSIKGDRTKLMQVIMNILKNSIEAIDAASTEKTILLNAFAHDGRAVIQVKDTGKGFDQHIASQLFRRGFTTKASGAGLGLHNCRTIIESHEGVINITSEGPGKGALTTIEFRI
jgi:PAS domain S-box-containing protein